MNEPVLKDETGRLQT